jgi:GA4 desaturase
MPGLVQQSSVRGTVRYNLPDLSVKPEDRGLFSGPAHKAGEDVDVDLYNPELAEEIIQGPEGLDVQGFTYVKHKSVLDTDDWLEGNNVEEKYVPEVEELVKQVTGAKKVIVNHLGIRKRLAANNNDPTFYRKAGDQHDEAVKKLTEKNAPWGMSIASLAFCRKESNLCPQSTVAQTPVSSPPDSHTATTP